MQNDETTVGLEWLIERIDHLLTGSLDTGLRGFGDGLACDSDAIAMQVTAFHKTLHQKWDAARSVHICRHVFSERLDIRNKRYTRAERIEIVDVQINVRFARQS